MFADRKLIARLNAEAVYSLDLYAEHGADSRYDYLQGLADDAGVDFAIVLALLDVLPPDEDFDGLVTAVQDAAMLGEEGW